MEQLDFTVVKNYRIDKIILDWANSTIDVTLRDNLGGLLVCSYTGAVATNLMIVLNTVDLSVKSLHKRIMEKLLTDGKVPSGTITGTP